MCLSERYTALGSMDDLRKAQEHLEAATATAEGADEWNEVGNARWKTHLTAGSADLLDSAVDAYQRAVELAVGDRDRPLFMGNLGNALLERWHRSRDINDISAAVNAYEEALELEEMLDVYGRHVVGAPYSPILALTLVNLARALFERASACDDDGDRARANELLRRVADAIEATNPTGGLGAALLWGRPRWTSSSGDGQPRRMAWPRTW
jgi:tetratricopeptide (TPR) repeat protein